MLRAGAGTEKSAIPHVTPGWKKLRELLPLLAYRVFSHKMKEKVYTAGFRSFMLYRSKVISAEFLEPTCKWHSGCVMSVKETENHQRSSEIG